MSNRTIIISDIHGCLDELKDLLEKVKYQPTTDRLISCGDIFDRGPYSLEALRYLRQLNAEVILGNHEDRFIRFHNHQVKSRTIPGYVNPMPHMPDRKLELYKRITEEDFAYLYSLPCHIDVTDKIKVIHAGAQANVPFTKQPRGNFIFLRYLKESGGAFAGTVKDTEKLTFWAEKWPGPETIIYGHYVHNLHTPVYHKYDDYYCLGIDTGCAFGGRLTAAVFEADQLDGKTYPTLVQVPARKEYMVWRSDGKGISDY